MRRAVCAALSLAVAVLVSACAGPMGARHVGLDAAPRQSIVSLLMDRQAAADRAEAAGDADLLGSMLSDDFLFTAPAGGVSDRGKLLADVRTAGATPGQSVEYRDVRALTLGDAVLLNFQAEVRSGASAQGAAPARYRYTVAWSRSGAAWLMRTVHVSRLRP